MGSQYCGAVGKVANSQNGVYLGYVSRKGYSLIAGQLYVLEDWFDAAHAEKRRLCGVPAELAYKTKPQIALELLEAAVRRGSLPFQWVAADELYGDSPAFRDGVAALDKWYFTEVKSTSLLWQTRPEVYLPAWPGRGRRPTRLKLRHPEDRPVEVKDLAADLPAMPGRVPPSRKAVKARLCVILPFCAWLKRARLARPRTLAGDPPQSR